MAITQEVVWCVIKKTKAKKNRGLKKQSQVSLCVKRKKQKTKCRYLKDVHFVDYTKQIQQEEEHQIISFWISQGRHSNNLEMEKWCHRPYALIVQPAIQSGASGFLFITPCSFPTTCCRSSVCSVPSSSSPSHHYLVGSTIHSVKSTQSLLSAPFQQVTPPPLPPPVRIPRPPRDQMSRRSHVAFRDPLVPVLSWPTLLFVTSCAWLRWSVSWDRVVLLLLFASSLFCYHQIFTTSERKERMKRERKENRCACCVSLEELGVKSPGWSYCSSWGNLKQFFTKCTHLFHTHAWTRSDVISPIKQQSSIKKLLINKYIHMIHIYASISIDR